MVEVDAAQGQVCSGQKSQRAPRPSPSLPPPFPCLPPAQGVSGGALQASSCVCVLRALLSLRGRGSPRGVALGCGSRCRGQEAPRGESGCGSRAGAAAPGQPGARLRRGEGRRSPKRLDEFPRPGSGAGKGNRRRPRPTALAGGVLTSGARLHQPGAAGTALGDGPCLLCEQTKTNTPLKKQNECFMLSF